MNQKLWKKMAITDMQTPRLMWNHPQNLTSKRYVVATVPEKLD